MKFFKCFLVSAAVFLAVSACKENGNENPWNIEIKNPAKPVVVKDISKEFYNPAIPLEQFVQKYPWFQGSVSDEDYAKVRTDQEETKIYQEAIAKIDISKLNKELTDLFSHVQFYFPEFKQPQVYLFSSALQGIMEPVFYRPDKDMLFIDISGFMGENNPHYKGLQDYFQTSMNPKNIIPKVSEILAEYFVPHQLNNQKFIDELVYQGKLMTLQDAFLPEYPDDLKINYTAKQMDWAHANEANIWNYFVENNLVFSSDTQLAERFIKPGPFSKFYTEIDNESSPQIGIFSGWQICRKFFQENPKVKLIDFLQLNAQEIFNQSNYKPKN